jgi:hypothetical protein
MPATTEGCSPAVLNLLAEISQRASVANKAIQARGRGSPSAENGFLALLSEELYGPSDQSAGGESVSQVL